jgi:hypothetical protein
MGEQEQGGYHRSFSDQWSSVISDFWNYWLLVIAHLSLAI